MSLDITLSYNNDGNEIDVFDANITHNITKMAEVAGIYEALWHPEKINAKKAKDLIEILTWKIPKNSIKNRKTRNNIEIIKVYAIPTEKRSKDVLYRIKRSDNKFFTIDKQKREDFLHYKYTIKVYREYEEAKAQENRLKDNRYNHHFSYNCKNMSYKIESFVLKTIIKRELLIEKL